ncbi:hypothetical protein E4V99_10720 [Microbacterium sp. dk485]|uniref:ATP-binding protein n=1 Tax=Microbacterium sp. dk485 TaxID=2560021 RepID=UPI0010733BD5|nr:ATP-binding protein [Microbacterium sp. dk485]TFV81470.1 hypothetical protein E4V99_10720 [Microbacterium sp. dk485]
MTSGLRLRALRLRVTTSAGELGRTIRFGAGLSVLRADNTSGKSTALQAIVYALGLEGMLSPSQRVPLPHAMTDQIDVDGQPRQVEKSWIEIEVENADGRVVTVRRGVVGADRDRRLVTVTEGAAITENGSLPSSDFFVRRQGAAQNEAGFHRFLAEFMGLRLPRVSTHDGGEVPLYLETLFPYYFVEQKHGWSGVQARIPTYMGIRDVGKRSAEYVLGLDVFERTLLRQRLRSTMSELESDWQAACLKATELAANSKLVIRNPPGRISGGLGEASLIPVVAEGTAWIPITQAIETLTARLTETAGDVPSAGEAASHIEADLQFLEGALREALAVSAALAEEEREARTYISQVEARIDALREDLQRHLDSQVLESYGSAKSHDLIAEHVCPTCHQELNDGSDISRHAMSAAESITYIRRQVATFQSMRDDHERVLRAIAIRRTSLSAQVSQHRTDIRVARDTLVSASSTPSVAAISRRLSDQARVNELEERYAALMDLRTELERLARDWAVQRDRLHAAESGDLSRDDERKIEAVEATLRSQLAAYGFKSLRVEEIDIDRTTFRPTHDGFDLGFDLSASDMIRLIWAYLFSLLEVGQATGNHAGLLLFDEPRQQDTAKTSYGALLAHASRMGDKGAQIVFATSETRESLLQMLSGHHYELISLDPGEKLLLPIDNP